MQNDQKKNPVEALASTRREQTEDQTSQNNCNLSLCSIQEYPRGDRNLYQYRLEVSSFIWD